MTVRTFEMINNLTTEIPKPDIISTLPFQHEHGTLELILNPAWLIIFIFGIISNITNILVFLKSGVNDNVTVLLLCLSVSDFSFLIVMTPQLATRFILKFAPNWNWRFDMGITELLFYWPAFTLYDCSAYASVFLGITRCACVALPFRFKSVFTKSRTIKSVVVLFFSTILLRMPVLYIHSIGTRLNPLTNQTYAYLRYHGSPTNVLVNDTLNRTSLPWIAFIIMIACVIILNVKLMEASKVRQSTSSGSLGMKHRPDIPGQKSSSQHTMSSKETRVVQSVVMVCVIFILSQLPFLLYSTARLLQPELDVGKKLRYLFGIFTQISFTCSFLNASVNIFIYYKYNSKYRFELKSMFCNNKVKS